jgi:hypothetical protein
MTPSIRSGGNRRALAACAFLGWKDVESSVPLTDFRPAWTGKIAAFD